jgi:hypothetical protein
LHNCNQNFNNPKLKLHMVKPLQKRRLAVRLALLFLLGCTPIFLKAQTRQVSGRVTSDAGETMPGVSIVVKGTTTGTTTDIDGKYSINADQGTSLVFSFIGMISREMSVSNSSTLNVELATDISQLEEVIVVGYGTQRKSDLTGSVSSVKASELTAFPVANAVQALQGRAAGVSV